MNHSSLSRITSLVLAFAVVVSCSQAADKRLSSTAGSTASYGTAATFDPSGIPAIGDDVIFDYANQPTPTTTTVTLDGNRSANSLTFGGAGGLGAFSLIANASAVTARNLTLGTGITVASGVTGPITVGSLITASTGNIRLIKSGGTGEIAIVNNSNQTLSLFVGVGPTSPVAATELSLNGGNIIYGREETTSSQEGDSTYTGITRIGNTAATTVKLAGGGDNQKGIFGARTAGTTVSAGSSLDFDGYDFTNTTNPSEPFNISGAGVGGLGVFQNSGRGSGNVTTLNNLITLEADSTISATGGDFTFRGSSAGSGSGGINNGGFLLTFAGAGNTNISASANTITGSGGLTKAGSGSLNINAATTFTGVTNITGGQIVIGSAAALQNSTLNYANANAGTLSFGTQTATTVGGLSGDKNLALVNTTPAAVALTVGNNNASTEYSGAFSGTGRLVKTGTGTLTLSGNSSYSGTTTVSAGTLLIKGDNSTATGTVTVAALATLGGNGGTIGGATTLIGILSPGESPGILSFSGTGTRLTMANSARTIMEIGDGARGVGYDGINVIAGNILYDGTLEFYLATTVNDGVFDLFNFVAEAGSSAFDAVEFSGSVYTGAFTLASPGVWIATAGPTSQQFTFSEATGDLTIVPVPEPVSYAMFLGGVCALMVFRRRRVN